MWSKLTGPRIVAVQWNKFSPTGQADILFGGSFSKSAISFWILFTAAIPLTTSELNFSPTFRTNWIYFFSFKKFIFSSWKHLKWHHFGSLDISNCQDLVRFLFDFCVAYCSRSSCPKIDRNFLWELQRQLEELLLKQLNWEYQKCKPGIQKYLRGPVMWDVSKYSIQFEYLLAGRFYFENHLQSHTQFGTFLENSFHSTFSLHELPTMKIDLQCTLYNGELKNQVSIIIQQMYHLMANYLLVSLQLSSKNRIQRGPLKFIETPNISNIYTWVWSLLPRNNSQENSHSLGEQQQLIFPFPSNLHSHIYLSHNFWTGNHFSCRLIPNIHQLIAYNQ